MFLHDLTSQIPILTKRLQKELTIFVAKGSKLSNHKLCDLDSMFITTLTTLVIPTIKNIFNHDLVDLEAIKMMCSMTDSRLLELVPKVS